MVPQKNRPGPKLTGGSLFLSDYQRGYIEGLIDGEGCISRSANRWMLTIKNTNVNILLKAQAIIGGAICSHSSRETEKSSWGLHLRHSALLALLPQITLIEKESRRQECLKDLLQIVA
jgi:hypothetical protein